MTRKKAEQLTADELVLIAKEKEFDAKVAVQAKEKEDLTAVAASIFSVTVQNAEKRLTKGGTQYDKIDLALAIENQPEYVVSVIAYNKTVYSVTVFKFDNGEKLYFSPKSSISDTAAWLVADAKIAPGMATELKKTIITARRASLAKLAEQESND